MARGPGRLARIALAALCALVVLLGALALLLQTGPVSRRVAELVVPRASAALGREVRVAEAKLRLLPRPRVALRGATVAGREGEPPLLELEALEVSLRPWPLLTSLGKDVEVEGLRLVRPIVNLVRARDGTWSHEGLGSSSAPPRGGESQTRVVIDHLAVEDGAVRIVDRAAGGQAALAVSAIQLAADHVGVGEPLQARISAALAGPERNLRGALRVSALPASLAALGPGSYPDVTGELALQGLDLARVRALLPPELRGAVTGGRADADASLSTERGVYRLEGKGRLSQVRLRGEPAQGSFELHARVDPARGALQAEVEKLALKGPGLDLGGRVTLEKASPAKVRFALSGPLLDLGQLMGLLPAEEGAARREPGEAPLTSGQRREVHELDVAGTLHVDELVKGAFRAEGLDARAALERGVLVLHEARARFFGGGVDAAGTRVDLSQASPRWSLQAKLDAVDLGAALQALAGAAPLQGRLGGTLDLDGAGVEWASLARALTGHGALALKEGALTTADLGGEVLGALAQGLRAAGKGGLAAKAERAGGRTELRDLAAEFTVKDGALALARPLTFTAPFGAVRLGGRVGLGGALDLDGSATLPPAALRSLTGGAVPVAAPLEVPLALGGTLFRPSVTVKAGDAAAGLLQGGARAGARALQQGAEERARREARRGLGDVLRRLGK